MESKEMNGSDDSRARYVWDREKLSWVESDEAPRPGEPEAESAIEEPLDAGAEATGPSIVSAEGEELQLRGAFMRFIGLAIDMVVLMIVTTIVQVIFGTGTAASAFLMPLIGFAYFVGFWTLRGQTPGKMAIGARIVRLDGSPAGFLRLFARYAVYLVYFYAIAKPAAYWPGFPIIIGVIIFSVVALSRSKRGFHDLAAGTIVINSRPQLMEDYEEEVWEASESESDALLIEED